MVSTWNSSSNPNSSQPWLLGCEGAPSPFTPRVHKCAASQAWEGSSLASVCTRFFFFSFFFIFKCALKSLDPPFLCCLWKEAGWYLRDSFITLESVFTICSAVSGVSLSLQARRNSCCVLNWQSGRDPCSLEGKQEWIVPSHCAVPSLLSLCKLTRCVVYSSSIECFKQILFFFFLPFFRTWAGYITFRMDGWWQSCWTLLHDTVGLQTSLSRQSLFPGNGQKLPILRHPPLPTNGPLL